MSSQKTSGKASPAFNVEDQQSRYSAVFFGHFVLDVFLTNRKSHQVETQRNGTANDEIGGFEWLYFACCPAYGQTGPQAQRKIQSNSNDMDYELLSEKSSCLRALCDAP